jgi:hypothetical protein
MRSPLTRLLRPGTPVVHRGLDDPEGVAKVGIVAERLEDAESGLVVARWRDEEGLLAFDERELEPLIALPLVSRGPMLLYPRHLWAALRRGRRLFASATLRPLF